MQRSAWPCKIHENISINVANAAFTTKGNIHTNVPFREVDDAWVVNAAVLRELADATFTVSVECKTTAEEVADTVFKSNAKAADLTFGYKVLCQTTKYRAFMPGKAGGVTAISLQLSDIGGEVQIEPLFAMAVPGVSSAGVPLCKGAIVGYSSTPMLVQIDRQLYGDRLHVEWRNFDKAGLPINALVHVQLLGDNPEVWLNDRFKVQLAMLDTKGRGLESIAGDALRRMIHVMVWERVLLWALEHEDLENEKLPATRIVDTWRRRFKLNGFDLPAKGNVDADDLNVMSLRIQHCLETGPAVARIEGILEFKTV